MAIMTEALKQKLEQEIKMAKQPDIVLGMVPVQQIRNITITTAANGYIITVGCQTFVCENSSRMLQILGAYLADPAGVTDRWLYESDKLHTSGRNPRRVSPAPDPLRGRMDPGMDRPRHPVYEEPEVAEETEEIHQINWPGNPASVRTTANDPETEPLRSEWPI